MVFGGRGNEISVLKSCNSMIIQENVDIAAIVIIDVCFKLLNLKKLRGEMNL